MKTKNMRKKALLSSVAMLLVAVVALSSATYAWFTANSAATVHGVKLSSTTASSLQFSTTENGEYSAILNLGVTNQTLTPVSSVDTTAFYQVNADMSTPVATAADTKIASISTAADTCYYKTEFYVKAGSDTGIALTAIAAGTLAPAIRVGFVIGAQKVVYETAKSGTVYAINNAVTAGNTTGMTYGEMYKGTTSLIDSVKNCTAEQTTLTPSTTKMENVALLSGVAQKVTMFVWLEGNDTDCIDSMANQVVNDLSLSFALAA